MRTRTRKLNATVCVFLGLLGLLLIRVSLGDARARPQAGRAAEKGSDQQFQPLIHSVEGPDLFRAYCASCHGLDAKGHGPAAAALKASVPDLTVLAKSNRGQFPSDRVRSAIMGDEALPSHGSREMPIWGPIFHQVEWDVDRGNVRLENLVKYLESIQVIPSSQEERGKKASSENSPSGAELYAKYCAACHGDDLKGNIPAPYPFTERSPDLTTLARRHGGTFPDDYIEDVLRHGVMIPAHGPPEMPNWGEDFRADERLNEAQVTQRITNLKNYIKSLQAK
jgi:mono/diheme cytochrome c family protein